MRMVRITKQGFLALALLALAAGVGLAQDKKDNSAVKPVPKDENWKKRHEGFVEIAKKGNVDVLFIGDSITDAWRSTGKKVWDKEYEPLKAANFGIGGDQTQHVLWRLQNGEMDGIKPKVAVVMIGTNNLGGNPSNEFIADGIKAVVEEIHKKSPETKVLLLGVFPRSPKAEDNVRDRIKEINKTLAKLDDGKGVKYLDIGEKFLGKDGELTKDIMPDFLHLTPKGYEIWAESIRPSLEGMLKK